MEQVAFLGLGAMGSRMAARLVGAGFPVAVWNRSPGRAEELAAKGARAAASARAAAEGAGIVFSMVRDDAAARETWLDPAAGALGGMRAGALAVECSTVSPGWAQRLHAAAAAAGVDCLDAPVAGSLPQAAEGRLIFLAGGGAAALERARPALEAMGGAVHHAGAAGSGATVKLLINTLLGVQVATMAELIGAAGRAGLDPARAVEIMMSTPAAAPSMKGHAALMLSGDTAPRFPVALIEKDFGYAEQLAGGAEEAPMAAAARAVFQRAIAQGMGAENMTAVARLYG